MWASARVEAEGLEQADQSQQVYRPLGEDAQVDAVVQQRDADALYQRRQEQHPQAQPLLEIGRQQPGIETPAFWHGGE